MEDALKNKKLLTFATESKLGLELRYIKENI